MTSQRDQSSKHPVIQEYSRLAAEYDTKWSFYIEATTRETMARLDLGPDDRVLDVGCGTGAFLDRLSQSHPPAQLVGVDPVPAMLAIARRRLGATVELHEGWAESLPFAAGQFNVVVSCNAFHYIRDPLAAVREMVRVLRPGGQIVITDWCDDYLACRLCDLYLRMFSAAHVEVYRERECVQLLRDAGLADVEIDRYRINWIWGLMTAKTRRHAT